MQNARDKARAEGVPESEVAKICWRCGQTGKPANKVPAPNGNGFIQGYTCDNALCLNYNTGWVVHIDAKGNLVNRMGERNVRATEFTKESADRLNRIGSSAFDQIMHDAEESVKSSPKKE